MPPARCLDGLRKVEAGLDLPYLLVVARASTCAGSPTATHPMGTNAYARLGPHTHIAAENRRRSNVRTGIDHRHVPSMLDEHLRPLPEAVRGKPLSLALTATCVLRTRTRVCMGVLRGYL